MFAAWKSLSIACKRCASSTVKKYFDIAIVGGGMVGNAMACSLSLNPSLADMKILLLESESPIILNKESVYSNRVSAISPASVSFFKDLGVWEEMKKFRVKRVDCLEVSDGCSLSTTRLEQMKCDLEVAYIVENNVIISCLMDRLKNISPNIEIKTNMRLKKCGVPKSLNNLATLKLEDGTEVETSLLIGADGARSTVRTSCGIDYTHWEYGQKGVVAVVELLTDDGNFSAWQRFLPNGPLALLPLNETLSCLIWSTSNEEADRLLKISPEEFIDELNHHLSTMSYQDSLTNNVLCLMDRAAEMFVKGSRKDSKPPRVKGLQVDQRAAYPLGFGHSHLYISTRAALIGDAAHRIHPLAGQGVNLGWADVRTLTRCIEKCVQEGGDIGSLTYLSEYDTESRRRNLPMQIACDWLNRLYRTDITPVVFIRSLGLKIFDSIEPLKNFVVSQTSSVGTRTIC